MSVLRIWQGSSKRVTCKHCRRPIQLVIDDRGKYLPFAERAVRLCEDKTLRGTFDVFDRSAFHRCKAKPMVGR